MSCTGSLPSYPAPSLQKSRLCSTESQPLTPPTGFCNVREQLHRCLRQSVEVTPERLERLLLTGIGEMLPYETIQTIVSVAYRPEFVPSVGHLSGLVNHTGTIAGLILNDERVTSAFQAAACDEIFFHQQPILTVVEPDSMAIGAIEKMGNRTAESWQAVLSHFPKLRYVVSDLARGLIKGVQLSGNLLHQGEMFHFFRDVGRTTQRLERHRLLKEETDAWDKWCAGRIYTPTLENTLAKINTFLAQMEQYYHTIERLSLAFWPIMDNGRLLTEKQAKLILTEVRSRLSSLVDAFGLADLIKQVRNAQTHCLSYLREISHKLGRLVYPLPETLRIPKNHLLRLAIEDVCLRYAFSQGVQVHREYLSLWEMLWPLGNVSRVGATG